MTVDEAFAVMYGEVGHFDPHLLDLFSKSVEEVDAIRQRFLEAGVSIQVSQ